MIPHTTLKVRLNILSSISHVTKRNFTSYYKSFARHKALKVIFYFKYYSQQSHYRSFFLSKRFLITFWDIIWYPDSDACQLPKTDFERESHCMSENESNIGFQGPKICPKYVKLILKDANFLRQIKLTHSVSVFS